MAQPAFDGPALPAVPSAAGASFAASDGTGPSPEQCHAGDAEAEVLHLSNSLAQQLKAAEDMRAELAAKDQELLRQKTELSDALAQERYATQQAEARAMKAEGRFAKERWQVSKSGLCCVRFRQ